MTDTTLIDLDSILEMPEPHDIEDIIAIALSDGKPIDLKSEVAKALPYTRRVSLNDIIPEEYQMRLMALDDAMSRCYWEIGDIADDIIRHINTEQMARSGRYVTNKDIFEAIGFFCHRSGRTVRYYHEIAKFFPPDVRAKYEVPFATWGEARWVDKPELVLQIASENPQMSLERVRAEYYHQMNQEPPRAIPPREDGEEEPIRDSGAELPLPEPGEQWSGEAQPRFRSVMVAKLEATIDDLRRTADRIPLPTPLRVRIGDVLVELQEISLELRREG